MVSRFRILQITNGNKIMFFFFLIFFIYFTAGPSVGTKTWMATETIVNSKWKKKSDVQVAGIDPFFMFLLFVVCVVRCLLF